MNPRPPSSDASETRGLPALWLGLVGLWGLAVAQPLLDLLGRTTAFFVAHQADTGDVVLFALVVSLAGPTLLAFVAWLLRRMSRRVAGGFEVFVWALLGALVIARGLRLLEDLAPAGIAALVAILAGALAAAGLVRWRAARTALLWLGAAALCMPLLFLFASPIRGLRASPDDSSAPPAAESKLHPRSAVLVVFDELPLVSLLGEGELIDAERFPNFAALAATATWYRNATTVAQSTAYAVPAILSGRHPEPRTVQQPVWNDYRSNLFTAIGRGANLHGVEVMSSLCPKSLCTGSAHLLPRRVRLRAMVQDSSAVYLHLVTPAAWSEKLPVIGESWRDFWTPAASAELPESRKPWDQDPSAVFERFVGDLASFPPPALHYVHLMTPHLPWNRLPDGRVYATRQRAPHGLVHQRWRGTDWEVLQAQQRHLLQVGWVDTLVGRLRRELEELGRWHDAIVVITSDHGTSFEPGGMRRNLNAANFAQIVNVPLFIKYPGQSTGTIDDSNVETVDIMPTLLAAMGGPAPGGLSGRDLAADKRRATTKTVFHSGLRGSSAGKAEEYDPDRLLERRRALERQRAVFGVGSWERVFAIGPFRELLDRPVEALAGAEKPPARPLVRLDVPEDPSAIDPAAEPLPIHWFGRVEQHTDDASPIALAIALDGVVRAVTETYPQGEQWLFSVLIPPEALAGGPRQAEFLRLSGSAEEPRARRLIQRAGKRAAESGGER